MLGFQPSVQFTGAVDALVGEPVDGELLDVLRGALAAAHRREGVSAVEVEVDATARLPDGRAAVRLVVADDGRAEDGERSPTVTAGAALRAIRVLEWATPASFFSRRSRVSREPGSAAVARTR